MSVEGGVTLWQRNVYALAALQFLSYLGFFLVVPLMPLYIQELGAETPAQAAFWTGVVQFAAAAFAFIAGPVWGTVADRYGRKPVILGTSAAVAIVMALTGLAPNIGVLAVLRMLHGAFTAAGAASMALATSHAPRERVPFAVGLLQMTSFLGIAAGPLLGGVVADAAGYRLPFFVTAGLVMLGVVIVSMVVREQFEPPRETTKRRSPLGNVRLVLSAPRVAPLLAMYLAIQFGPFMLQPVTAGFMQSMVARGAATSAGLALSLLGLGIAATSLVVGRWGRPDWLPLWIAVAAFGAAAFYLPQAWVQSPALAAALFGGLGLCQGALLTSVNSLLSASVPREHQGAMFGIAHSVFSLAFGTAALTAGTLSVTLGIRSIFPVEAALICLVGLAALWMRGHPRRADAPVL